MRVPFAPLIGSALLALSCGGGSETVDNPSGGGAGGSSSGNSGASGTTATPTDCEQRLVTRIEETLAVVATDTDFSLLVRSDDGRELTFERGTSTLDTSYESASTSKWVTSAVLLDLVDQGVLSLDDRPQAFIDFWTPEPNSPLERITLAHLLSFTSGLEESPACIELPGVDFERCVQRILEVNSGSTAEPGSSFYYGSPHMQVAALMAVKATALADWNAVFNAFKARASVFPNAVYDLPSASNPRTAGGMHWTAREYVDFLEAFRSDLLSSELMGDVLQDRTATAELVSSPIASAGMEWHYGLGFWLECAGSAYNCEGITTISSPGAYGAYPFIDYDSGLYGLVARQGRLGTAIGGYDVYRSVRDDLLRWASLDAAACSTL